MPPVPQAGSSSLRTVPGVASSLSSLMNRMFTISRMTSRGVKWSPAVSLASSLKRRMRFSKMSPICSFGTASGVQVHVAELGDDEVEDVRLAHPLDLVLELEEIEDVAHVLREALDVADEVLLDVVGVALQLLEVERRVVVEALAGGFVE